VYLFGDTLLAGTQSFSNLQNEAKKKCCCK
jgi:hypothetical protein